MNVMRLSIVVLAVVFVLLGCKKKEAVMAPMGESAPTFGQAAEHKTLQGFVVGRWCVVSPAGILPKRYYEFKSDGSFESAIVEGDWKTTGKWVVGPNNISLTYEKMNGKSMQDFQAQYKKDEEGGGQVSVQRALVYDQLFEELGKMTALWVEEDGKHLTFSQPTPPAQLGTEENPLDNLAKMASYNLERMAPKKED